MMTNTPVIWTIAGSDPTGGAGIQADIKTANNLGAHACSILTAVTVQNTNGVYSINPVDTDVLRAQIHCLENDKPPRVIKIGLLASSEQVELVSKEICRLINSCRQRPTIVYDPVAIASSGGRLTQDNTLEAIKQYLLPLVDVLTPNQPELQALTNVTINDWADYRSGAEALVEMGVKSAVIKGGHVDVSPDHSIDFCLEDEQEYWLASERIKTDSHHGTGCTFASAIASLIAQGYLLRDSFTLAKAYINQGLRTDSGSGAVWQGPWPSTPEDFPHVLVPQSPLAHQLEWHRDDRNHFAADFASMDCQKLGLYPVVDSVAWCERLLNLGVKTIQYREKTLTGSELEQAIKKAIALGKKYDARLFINDYWQLAIEHAAYGVHLGQEDLCDTDLAAIKQAGLRLGISTHGHFEMLKTMQFQPSYLAVGAIFPTRTKDMTGQIQGVKTLNDLVRLNPHIPTVAIGGINAVRAPVVAATGVGSIAVVTAITEADDPEAAVAQLQAVMAKS